MALQFILGSSGSGKTEYLYEKILKDAGEKPERMFYVIVPEQFTMQTQKELVSRQKNHAIMNIDVVSFDRLAYRIFDELGIQDLVVLEDTGKNLILRKLAADHQKKLTALKHNISRMGYIDQVKSLISEFMQYGFSPEDLREYLEKEKDMSALDYKLKDILLLYEAFADYMKGRFVTSETLLGVLADCASRSGLLKDAVLAFDGFTGFTPVQMELMGSLMKTAGDIYVTCCIDIHGELYGDRGIQELFYMSRKMLRALEKTARESDCQVKEPILIQGEKGRFADNPALSHLERNLFRPKGGTYRLQDRGDRPPAVSLYSLSSPREELLFAVAKIRELTGKYGFRYNEIAIVSGNAQGYEKYAPEIFEMYDIPWFSDTKESILFHPFIEWIRSVMEMLEKDFSRESVFRYLRSGLARFTMEETDLLENYVLERGIRGFKKWNEKWVHPSRISGRGVRVSQEESLSRLEELNGLRERFISQLGPVKRAAGGKDRTVKSLTLALYELMVSLGMQEQLKKKQEEMEEAREEVKASIYGQIYRIVIDLLDKVVDLLGEEKITVKDYSDILDAAFQAAKAGSIPQEADCVILGDIERTRLDHIKILIFLGLNDGIIPKKAERGSLLSQYDREQLALQDMELAPTAREQVFLQKFYLYWNMTKPSEGLILTCARMDSLGNPMKYSYLTGVLCRMFEGLEAKEISGGEGAFTVTVKNSLRQYVRGLQKAKDEEITVPWKALHHWLMEQPHMKSRVRELFDAAFACYDGEKLSPRLAGKLYGTVLYNSVTRIEKYSRCACAHFLEYGLRLCERPEFSFKSADLGTLFHNALEAYSRSLQEAGVNWFEVTERQQEEFLKNAVTDTVLGMDTSVLEDSSRSAYMVERIRKILSRSVWALTCQIRKGAFHPLDYEIPFRQEIKPEGVKNARMYISGRIDRLDTYENDKQLYVKIMDYKSGRQKFQLLDLYHGLQLQLTTYLNAALTGMGQRYKDKDVIPAGIFYYHLDDPMVEAGPDPAPEELEEAILGNLRPDGLVSSDAYVISKLDKDLKGRSDVIPVTLKQDGTLSARGCSTADRKKFEHLARFTEKKIQETAGEILDGKIQARPAALKDADGCQYCPYSGICGFDIRIPGYEKQQLEELDEEELWKRICGEE